MVGVAVYKVWVQGRRSAFRGGGKEVRAFVSSPEREGPTSEGDLGGGREGRDWRRTRCWSEAGGFVEN